MSAATQPLHASLKVILYFLTNLIFNNLKLFYQMHPQLIPHEYPSCATLMEDFLSCQKENFYNRYIGVCDRLKSNMLECMQVEVIQF